MISGREKEREEEMNSAKMQQKERAICAKCKKAKKQSCRPKV